MSATLENTLKAYQHGLDEVRRVERTASERHSPASEGELADLLAQYAQTTRAILEQNEHVIKALMHENESLTKQIQTLKQRPHSKASPADKDDDDEDANEPLFFAHIRDAWSVLRNSK
jgi:hypothetical protein